MEEFQKWSQDFIARLEVCRNGASESIPSVVETMEKADQAAHPIELKEETSKRIKFKARKSLKEVDEEKDAIAAKPLKNDLELGSEDGHSPKMDTSFKKQVIQENEKSEKNKKKRKYEELKKFLPPAEETFEFLDKSYTYLEPPISSAENGLQQFPLSINYELFESKEEEIQPIKKKKKGIHGLKEFRKTSKDWKNSPYGRIWTSSFRLLFTSNSKWTLSQEGLVWLKTLKGKNEISSKSWEFLMARGFEHLQVIIGEATGSLEVRAALIYSNMRCLRAVELQCNQTCSQYEPTLSPMSEFSSRKNRGNASKKTISGAQGTLNNPIGEPKEEYKFMISELKLICEKVGVFSTYDVPSTIDILKVVEIILLKLDEVKLRKAAFGVGKWWYNTPEDCEDVYASLLNISKLLALHQVLIDKAPKNGIRCGPISAMIYDTQDDEQISHDLETDFVKIETIKASSQKLLHKTYYGGEEIHEDDVFIGQAQLQIPNIEQIAQNVLYELGLDSRKNVLENEYLSEIEKFENADDILSKSIYSYCDEMSKPSMDETFGMETEDESCPPKPKTISIEKAKEQKDAAEVLLGSKRMNLAKQAARQLFEKSKNLAYWIDNSALPLSNKLKQNLAEQNLFCMEVKKSLNMLGGIFSDEDEKTFKKL
jgi:hypothetical protein